MGRSAFTVLLLLPMLFAASGCERNCDGGTVLVTLTYDDTALSAERVRVLLTVGEDADGGGVPDGGLAPNQVVTVKPHMPGRRTETVQVEFPRGYPAGRRLRVQAVACRGVEDCPAPDAANEIGAGSFDTTLTPVCLEVPVSIMGPTVGRSSFDVVRQTPPTLKLDILFMVDNSSSMLPMSDQLKVAFDQFFTVFKDLAAKGTYADLHIGVVTSDYGAGYTGAPGCEVSPGGQRGRLQSLGKNADSSCAVPVNANFIRYKFAPEGSAPIHNLPPTLTFDKMLGCMASVGVAGCGFEHQLESVYAALHNPPVENLGFLRDDALLEVVFLTNEDDGSAPPDSDVYDRLKLAEYGIATTYRQTHFGIVCGPDGTLPPYGDSMGPLTNCKPAPNLNGKGPGKLYDVQRYIDFFTKPATQGGVKYDPSKVILVAIDAPAEPVQIILSNPATTSEIPCQTLNEMGNPPCVPVLKHSCTNPKQPDFFGDPAVRLNAVVNAVPKHAIFSICDADFVAPILQAALGALASDPYCIPALLSDPAAPSCDVVARTIAIDGTLTERPISPCDAADGGPCSGSSEFPCPAGYVCSSNRCVQACWAIVDALQCRPQGKGLEVHWPDGATPAYTWINATCKTVSFPF